MKTPRSFALLLAVLLALLVPRPAEARVETSFDFFYDSLSPYGEWVQIADYGYCWRPTDVDEDWSPYSDGYWAFTDAGWTWVSYEDFGGIVYHYGRWVRVEDAGWCWVPDYEWGPAWVSWRNNDDYVGWAPLPPEARWQPSVGISVWVDRDCDIGPSYYSFCRVRDFGAPVLRPVIINRMENVTIIRRTVNITNITYNTHYSSGPVIYNGGPSFAFINERSSRRIPALKLVQNTNIDLNDLRDGNRGDRDRRRNFNGQAVGNQLVVTAPYVRPPTDPGFLRPQVKRVIAADKVSRGWGMVKNDEIRREMKQEMQRQTKGATRDTTPARAVAVTDLKVLPEKADPQAPSPVADRGNRDGRDGRDNRDGRDRNDRRGSAQTGVTGQPPVTPPTENGAQKPTAETNRPPVTTDEKTGRDKGRGPDRRDPQSPVAVDPTLKPFNPGNDPDSKSRRDRTPGIPGVATPDANRDPRTAQPGDDGARRRGSDENAGRMNERADQERTRQQAEAAAAAQQKQQMDAQRQVDGQRQAEAQRGADALRQQKEAAAAAGRQRQQADQDNAARQQADRQAADQQRRMQRDKADADQQGQRAQDAQREEKRRQQMEAAGDQQKQAAEQQRRQANDQQQQRGQREAAEQQRRAQDGQRQQLDGQRQQFEAQREAQKQQRQQQQQAPPQPRQQQQAQPQVAPPSATPADSDRDRRKKKD